MYKYIIVTKFNFFHDFFIYNVFVLQISVFFFFFMSLRQNYCKAIDFVSSK